MSEHSKPTPSRRVTLTPEDFDGMRFGGQRVDELLAARKTTKEK